MRCLRNNTVRSSVAVVLLAVMFSELTVQATLLAQNPPSSETSRTHGDTLVVRLLEGGRRMMFRGQEYIALSHDAALEYMERLQERNPDLSPTVLRTVFISAIVGLLGIFWWLRSSSTNGYLRDTLHDARATAKNTRAITEFGARFVRDIERRVPDNGDLIDAFQSNDVRIMIRNTVEDITYGQLEARRRYDLLHTSEKQSTVIGRVLDWLFTLDELTGEPTRLTALASKLLPIAISTWVQAHSQASTSGERRPTTFDLVSKILQSDGQTKRAGGLLDIIVTKAAKEFARAQVEQYRMAQEASGGHAQSSEWWKSRGEVASLIGTVAGTNPGIFYQLASGWAAGQRQGAYISSSTDSESDSSDSREDDEDDVQTTGWRFMQPSTWWNGGSSSSQHKKASATARGKRPVRRRERKHSDEFSGSEFTGELAHALNQSLNQSFDQSRFYDASADGASTGSSADSNASSSRQHGGTSTDVADGEIR